MTDPAKEIRFTVYGKPEPQGSSRAFIPKGSNRAVITSANSKLKPWRQQLSDTAIAVMGGMVDPYEGAVEVRCSFYFLRPKSTSKKILHKTTKPDVDKLTRAVFDALTGVCYRDDSQIVNQLQIKRFGDVERVEVVVIRL